MLIGVPKEIKNNEYRVGMTPASVAELVAHGHRVVVETEAGVGIGKHDPDYLAAGAEIAGTAAEVFERTELIVKVKEPQAVERAMLRPGQVLFTYLHLAPDPEQTRELLESGAVCIAYETVTSPQGGLPLLAPMSEVAGRMSIQAGAHCLEKSQGGKGILLGGVPGVERAKVVILGGGMVGRHAADVAAGMGADVWVLDRSTAVLNALWTQFGHRIHTVYSTRDDLRRHVLSADLVIGSVLIPGAAAPKLVTREMVAAMNPGSVLVDVSIDQGGCFETSRPTTHAAPTFLVDEVVHYCVANMPGVVPRTSTFALNNAVLPFLLAIADKGYRRALETDPHLLNGLNVCKGALTLRQVAEQQGLSYTGAAEALRR
ncbi:MAG: alanine dehydrogenase [Candidatus Thiodiazotropha sp.]